MALKFKNVSKLFSTIKSKYLGFYVPVAVYSEQQWGSLPT